MERCGPTIMFVTLNTRCNADHPLALFILLAMSSAIEYRPETTYFCFARYVRQQFTGDLGKL